MDIMDRLKGPRRNLPIGIQSFERLRRDGYLYVDKTAFVYELASTGNPYFLSRPRRFGKSLLLSTLEAYFCGKKELFEGLAIEQFETEWNEHAVLHLSLNAEDYSEIEGLRNGLELQLRSWEKKLWNQRGRLELFRSFHASYQRGIPTDWSWCSCSY